MTNVTPRDATSAFMYTLLSDCTYTKVLGYATVEGVLFNSLDAEFSLRNCSGENE
jgi:hypothetical protein